MLLLCAPALSADQVPDSVHHTVSFPERSNQYVHVRSTFPAGDGPVDLGMPSWTPGAYAIRDFAGQVERFKAVGPEGEVLPSRKISKNHWSVDAAGSATVTVDYDVWAGKLSVQTSWVEADIALLNGAGIFMYTAGSRKLPQQLRLQLPADWPSLHVALPQAESAHAFTASNYDELVDSPIVAGDAVELEFKVDGQPYALVLSGENPLWDNEKSKKDVAAIVRAQQDFWGVVPFERRYLFLNFFIGPYGGLEHDHSTVMMCSPWQMRTRKDYIKWLGLVSHEFFHAWNVRRMRPAALADYDYDREVYTRELWLAEGLSSYYDDLLLFRAGLVSVGEYLDLLANEIRRYETTPGREVRSAEQSSFDTWVKHYRPNGNSINSTVSYYRKGAVIGFVTDTAIRRASNNSASLDTVMRTMYKRFGPGTGGYPRGAFEDTVEQVAGPKVRRMVEDILQTTADPNVDGALRWYGLDLDRKPAAEEDEENGKRPPVGIGVRWESSGLRVLAEHVVRGHAAARAGVIPGDELVAIDGFRVTPENFDDRLKRLEPGEQATLTLVRHERLITLRVQAEHAIPESYVIKTAGKLGRREKSRLEAWLGRDLVFSRSR